MEFYHRCKRPNTIGQDLSREIETIYKSYDYVDEVSQEKYLSFKESSTTNIYDYIQEAAKGCSVQELIERYNRGDLMALSQRESQFLDVSDMPTDVLDLQENIDNSKKVFNDIKPEVKKLFNADNVYDFVKNFDENKLNAYINAKVQESINAATKKE